MAYPICCCLPNPEWMHPIPCNPTHYCDAESANGATLVIHKIVLEVGGEQGCVPRDFVIRLTGPSYPRGETFTLRAGSCLELDEPLVIAGLLPGVYRVDELFTRPHEYITTITGPVCGRCVNLIAGCVPTVITIVNRRRLCGRCCPLR